ncbi:MAG: hypothetical protein WBO46_25140 [Caldilineaceae bacterium]
MSSTFGCPHCGKANPLRAVFCASCGAYLHGLDAVDLTRSASAAAEDAPQPPPAETTPAQNPADTQPWLRPDFDPPDPPEQPGVEGRPSPEESQPWLVPDEESQAPGQPPPIAPQRLIGGLQGLLEPLELDAGYLRPTANTPPGPALSEPPYELRRELRQLFATDVPILDESSQYPAQPGPPTGQADGQARGLWRRNWIYGLLLAALLLALWAANARPEGQPHSWPGVTAAHSAIDNLPPDAVVLVNWAYDPANAGEMDQASLPVLEHLVEKGARLLVISQLPGGPATARRLISLAQASAPQSALSRQPGENLIEAGYLPGGVGSLALLGQAPAQGIPVDIQGRSVGNRTALVALQDDSPALLLVVAARSEEVQRWIEQVQPLNTAPIVAVVSAAVDPAIRPYVDSGQIAGIVSGYAGAIAYRTLLADVIPAAKQESQRRQITAQNWALAVLLLVVAVGNLAGLAERRAA